MLKSQRYRPHHHRRDYTLRGNGIGKARIASEEANASSRRVTYETRSRVKVYYSGGGSSIALFETLKGKRNTMNFLLFLGVNVLELRRTRS